jgi:flavin reductase (DIM6/NTAB) family NADH-FMN oxidoreductase RutF
MPLRAWNLAPLPVYSLAVYQPPASSLKPLLCNLNICTYVTPISLRPKLYLIAIYRGTRTHDLITQHPQAPLILHLLHIGQISLVPILAQRSGRRFEKVSYLQKKHWLTSWRGYPVLHASAAYILLKPLGIIQRTDHPGDHDLMLASVLTTQSQSDPSHVLTTHHLIDKQIILAPRTKK